MSEEKSQVEDTVQIQPTGDENQVEDTTILEGISNLLGNEPKESKEEPIQNEEKPIQLDEKEVKEEAKPVEEVQPEVQVLTIDDKLVEEFPALKMYLGKPLKDVGKAYQNLVKAFTENQKRLKQLEQEQAKKEIPQPSDFPDPVDHPEEFQKALADYTEKIKQQARLEYQNQPPQTDWVAEARKVIPEGVDFDAFRQDFMMFNAPRFYNEIGEVRPEIERFYNENPQILIDEMKRHYNLTSNAQKSKETLKKEVKDDAYKTITNSLKKAQENKEDLQGAQFNATERSTVSTPEQEILAKIHENLQGQ